MRVGLAKALLHEGNGWPDVIARVTWDSDSGDTDDNGMALGGFGTEQFGGSLTMVKRQDPLVFTVNLGYETTTEEDDQKPGDSARLSVGAILAASPQSSLRLIINQTYRSEQEINNDKVSGTDDVIGSLTLGASSVIGHRKFMDFAIGVGLTDTASDYSVRLSFSARMF